MDRRSALAAFALLPLTPAALAFNVKPLDDYRRHHLFILAPADDAAGLALAKRIAEVLSARLPESRAETVPVVELARLAEFLVSRQFDVAVMRTATADALAAGRAPFASHGPLPLKVLHAADGLVLVSRIDFLEADALRIAQALGATPP